MASTIYFFYLSINNFIGVYAWLGKSWAKTSLLCQDQIVAILRKRILKQAIERAEEKSEIAIIPNKYKDTFDNLIDSLNIVSLEALRSKNALIDARPNLEKNHLDKDGRHQRGEKDRQKGKKRQVIREDSSLEVSICY